LILRPINIDQYAEKSSSVGVFGSKHWLSVYGEALKVIGIFKDEHQMIGGFYFLKVKKFGFSFIKLPPYTPHCGLFFISESKNSASVNNFSKEVTNEVCSFFTQQKSALTILAFPGNLVDMQPFIWAKYKVVPNYTYQIDLTKPFKEITENFDSKTRNLINKSIKEELVVSQNTLSKDELFSFFVGALQNSAANIYKNELKNIFTLFSNETNSFSFEAKKHNQLLGVVFCIFDQHSCYYLLGGIDKSTGISGVNNLLVQKSIEKAQQLGCKIFDFEGSMLKGVEKFFRSFGPRLVPYYTVNKAKLPIEILLKFKKRELF
jgi:hypothetical protein